MEGLHVTFLKTHIVNVFRGISSNGIDILHLFYADDVVLMSQLDPQNSSHIIRILRCFYLASGIKINLHKNKLIGVGVLFPKLEVVTRKLGCAPDSCPFIHLGVPIGQNMPRFSAWSSVVDRFH